jgi:hypothetical protein
MTIYALHITAPGTQHPGVTVRFAAEPQNDCTALAEALIAVNRLAHALNLVSSTLVMGPQEVSTEVVQSLGVLHGMRGEFDPMLVADTDYQDAYLSYRIGAMGFGGLSDEEQQLLEVSF